MRKLTRKCVKCVKTVKMLQKTENWLKSGELIKLKEKHQHLSKTSHRVSRNAWGLSREGCIEVYIDNQKIFVIVY